jgi:hypothetical protein
MWECDLIGRIPTKSGNKYILVAVDNYTKWVEASVLNNKSCRSVAKCIEDLVIKKFGCPKVILTDNGKEFTGEECKKLATQYGIEWKFASPYHHKTTGLVERTNQTLWNKIRKISNFGAIEWESIVKKAILAVNISLQRSIGVSPFVAMYNKKPNFKFEPATNNKPYEYTRKEIETLREAARNKYEKEIVKGKKTIKDNFRIGEDVYIYKSRLKNKLLPCWHGGYKIVEKIEPDAFIVSNGISKFRLNKERLKAKRGDGCVVAVECN